MLQSTERSAKNRRFELQQKKQNSSYVSIWKIFALIMKEVQGMQGETIFLPYQIGTMQNVG